jgi:hypothetical protein
MISNILDTLAQCAMWAYDSMEIWIPLLAICWLIRVHGRTQLRIAEALEKIAKEQTKWQK